MIIKKKKKARLENQKHFFTLGQKKYSANHYQITTP